MVLYQQGCGITEASGQDGCCPEVSFSDKVTDFWDKNDKRSKEVQAASTYAITTYSYNPYVKSNYTEKKDAGGRDVCEAICTSPVKIYINKTAEFNLKVGNFYTQYFYTGKTAPNRSDLPQSDRGMSLYEIMMHEFGHYFGLNHTGDDAGCKSMGSGKPNQMLMASPRSGFGVTTREITKDNYNPYDQSPNPFQVIPNRDKCYFCKLYCPDKACASVNEKSELLLTNNITITPNPASTELSVKFRVGVVSNVRLSSVLGEELLVKGTEQNGVINYDISSLGSGLYFVTWKEKGINKSKKFVVQR